MWQRYSRFLRRPPELELEWHDRETEARGWLVLNSLRGGAAGGGTRMRAGVTPREVVYLAKAMELKFALAGPPIGGAKTGLDFDPRDPRKRGVLERWYRAIRPYLREHYGTGGDLGVDEVADVLPCFERLGLEHPQAGVVRGHLEPEAGRLRAVLRALDDGVQAPLADASGPDGRPLAVADVITGYGVARAIRTLYRRRGHALDGVRVLLEGFGNVGAACGLYLARAGARIVAVSDADKALVDPDGIGARGIESLIGRRRDKLLPNDDPRTRRGTDRDGFWNVPADLFVCAATSDSITPRTLDALAERGVDTIACGANQPFRERETGAIELQRAADRRFTILPDILANCGMARTFSYLMEPDARPEAAPITAAVDHCIDDALDEVLERAEAPDHGLLAATLALALDRIGAP